MIFHIDIDAFFASVEQGFNPLLKNKSVIVGGLSHERGCVHTASYNAREKGIYTGMSLREAKRICPDAIFLKGDFRQYNAASKKLEEIFKSYTPIVEISSLDDAYLDMKGLLRYYKSYTNVALKIKERIREELKVTTSIGIASSKLVARIASGVHKPDGLVEVPLGREYEFLSPLPIEKLRGIGRINKRKLHDLGVEKISDLNRLSKIMLINILGTSTGEKIWEYASGKDNREVKQKKVPKQISRETSFEDDIDDEEIIKGTIRYLTERITKKLRQYNLKTRRARLRIVYTDNKHIEKIFTQDPPTFDGTELFRRLMILYEKIKLRRVRVKNVSIAVSELIEPGVQTSIFSEKTDSENLNKSIDETRENFGFTSVFYADTMVLKKKYRMDKNGYILHTPALSQ